METIIDTKQEILRQAGYRYNFDRMVYINRDARKVFSRAYVDDNSEDALNKEIVKPNNSGQWMFYFNEAPSQAIKRDFLAEFDEHRAAG
jgi:hypothetical protein